MNTFDYFSFPCFLENVLVSLLVLILLFGEKKYFFYWHCNSTHARAQKSDFDAWQRAVRTFVQFCIRVRKLFQNQTQCIVIFHLLTLFHILYISIFFSFALLCCFHRLLHRMRYWHHCSVLIMCHYFLLFTLSSLTAYVLSYEPRLWYYGWVGWEKDDACVSMLLKCMSESNEQRNVSV